MQRGPCTLLVAVMRVRVQGGPEIGDSSGHAVDARAVVRVLDRGGAVVGAGFLVGRDLVATCAHVMTSAVGGDPTAKDAPAGELNVDFPLVRDPGVDQPIAATARVRRWVPIQPDGGGDIALLRLDRTAPPGVRMPPLRRVDALWGQDFRVLGFPAGMRDGVWATGTFRGGQGTRWCQLQGRLGDQHIVAGFSGAPVWDARSGAVVGMTVAADRDEETTTAYLIPIDAVLGLDPDLLPCPYRGLEPFGEEHRAFYFGRAREIQRLADAVARRPVVAVAGPSGVGKSSLVMAGLVPLLRDEGVRVVECRPAPGASAAVTVAAALIIDDPQAERELAEWLAKPTASTPVAALAAVAAGGTVLFMDQFEELVAAEPATARELLGQIIRLVGAMPSPDGGPPPLRTVLTLRWESLNELRTLELVEMIESGAVAVPSMGRAELRAAIIGPAEYAPGLGFTDGLVERILDDAGDEPGQLPLVESLLTQLWERREGGYLTLSAYDAVGGVSGAVARQAEDVLAGFADPADTVRLRRLFTQLATPDEDGHFVRCPVVVANLAAELAALLEPLVAGRLLVQGQAAGGPETVELAHQALIDHWPRLRGWLAEDQDFLAWRAELDRRREQWEAAGRDDGALLRGAALAQALERLPPRAEDVSAPSRDFVRRSQARQRREVRRWRVVTAVLVVLLLAAGGLTVAAVDRGNRLNHQLNAANAETLGLESDARALTDPVVASQLALAGFRADPTSPAARAALAHRFLAMSSVQSVLTGLSDQPIQGFQLSRDGDIMVLVHEGGFQVVTGLAGLAPRRWFVPGVPAKSVAPALSRDGRRLATVDAAGTVLLWDVATPRGPVMLHEGDPQGQGSPVIQFSPDASRLALLAPATASGGPRQLLIWDLRASPPVPQPAGPVTEPDVAAAWLTTDPNVVLLRFGSFERENSRLVARAVGGGPPLRTLPAGSAVVEHGAAVLACTPGNVTGSDTRVSVLVSDAATGAQRLRFPADGSRCGGRSLVISADTDHIIESDLLSRDADYRSMRVTDLVDGASFKVTMPPGDSTTDSLSSMPFDASASFGVFRTPDGSPRALLARNSSMLVLRGKAVPWSTDAGIQPGFAALSSGGRFLVGYDYVNFLVLDPASGAELGRLPVESRLADDLGYSVGDRLTVVTRPAQDWVLAEYAFPRLEETAHYLLPGPDPTVQGAGPQATSDGDTLVTLVGGMLTVWDRKTHRIRVEPIQLGTTADERNWWLTNNHLALRPGHPDEVALIAPDGSVELWNLPHRRRTGRISTTVFISVLSREGMAFDTTGNRLAIHTPNHTIEVWDVGSRQPARPPIPAPQVSDVVGFDEDGYLLTRNEIPGISTNAMAFWDLGRGTVSGSMLLPGSSMTSARIDDGRSLQPTEGRSSLSALSLKPLPVTARQWFDRLCAIGPRGFTQAELRILPPDASTGPPCS
jgi:WD40 repeat protein